MPTLLLVKRLLAALLFGGALILLVHLVEDLNGVKDLKTDLAEMHQARYGILDADQWVDRISGIVAKRIEDFELTDANRAQVTAAVAQVLDSMLVEIERYLRRRNLERGGGWMDQLQGVLQQGLQDLLIDFEKLRKKVPQYAEVVVEELSTPEAKREIKARLLDLIRQASDQTFAKTDRSPQQALFERYQCAGLEACSAELEKRIAARRMPILQQLGGLAALVSLLFILCVSRREEGATGGAPGMDPFQLLVLTGATLILLLGGVLTPMIEIEASIRELSLQFMGEPLVFTDQVLYFQSKSIFEVVRILAETGKPDMLLVAVLVTLFSVIFPAIKLAATYAYYYDLRGARRSGLVRFFALRSGKWSMADVMVVAIFMAYVGLDGLVGNQLGSLSSGGMEAGGAVVLTSNATALEPGFYLFLAFVLASLLLSARLEKHAE